VAFLDELQELLIFKEYNLSLMVAGGLSPRILPRVLEALSPEVVVVGSAVTRSSAPEETLKLLRRLLDEYEST
jgi:3-keto-L-gulonate-6-phosphate decarboxylase